MSNAEAKLNSKIRSMGDDQILATLSAINKDWNEYKPEERVVRSRLLNEYETRHGGEAVEKLMDVLDLALAN